MSALDPFRRLLLLGLPADADSEVRRRVVVLNAMIGVGTVAGLVFCVIDLLIGNYQDLLIAAGAAAGGALLAGLHAWGFRAFTRVAMAAFATGVVFVSALATAHRDLPGYLLLVVSACALVLFEPRERVARWLFALLPLLLCCLLEFLPDGLLAAGPPPGSDVGKLAALLIALVAPCALVSNLVSTQTGLRRELEQRVAQLQERQALLVQSSRMGALGEMAAGVAHEVNNPLTAVLLNVDRVTSLLAGPSPDARGAAERMGRAAEASRRISRIVGALLTFARQERTAPPVPVPVRELVDEALTGLPPGAQIDVPAGLRVLCHRPDLVSALANLLQNAHEATAPGRTSGPDGALIRISASSDGETVSLSVEDSGPGIPGELRERLMEPFATSKSPGAGPGLGLALSRALVRANGGQLVFDASARLTRFVITLPTAERPQ